jgi:hypothetical protein
MIGFPSDLSGYTLVPVPGTEISIIQNNPNNPGATQGCDQLVVTRLIPIFQQAVEDGASCISGSNTEQGTKFAVARARPLHVACNNPCPNTLASTDLPYFSWASQGIEGVHNILNAYTQRMNLEPGINSLKKNAEIEEILIHELMHFTGTDHNPPPFGAPEGHDVVYGCGRYCTSCKTDGITVGWSNMPPSAAQFAYDCADCSDATHIGACGELYFVDSCNNGACGLRGGSCPPGDVCCPILPLNCWSNQAEPSRSNGRSDYLGFQGAKPDFCVQVGDGTKCVTDPDPGCASGYGVNVNPQGNACAKYPVGICQSGP